MKHDLRLLSEEALLNKVRENEYLWHSRFNDTFFALVKSHFNCTASQYLVLLNAVQKDLKEQLK